jgi:glucose-1-phosphate thymidylyltransferase
MSKLASLIPAAGRGSRLGSIPCSKEIMPLGFRYQSGAEEGQEWQPVTAIETHLQGHRAAGAERCCVIIGRSKHDVVYYLGSGGRHGLSIAYLFQDELRGMPFALDLARPWVGQATVLFSMPDTLITPGRVFTDLAEYHRQRSADVTLGLFYTDRPEKFGMVRLGPDGRPIDFVDKPQETDLRLMWGMAAWSPRFAEFMHRYLAQLPMQAPECVLSDVFLAAMREGQLSLDALVFPKGHYHDIGTPASFQAAVYELALGQVDGGQ